MSKIKNIVFDIGNVLIDYNPRRFLDSFATLDAAGKSAILLHVFESPLWREIDRGTYSVADAVTMFCDAIPEHAGLIPSLLSDESLDRLFPELSDSVELFYELKREGYKMFLLSNFSGDGFKFVERKFPHLREDAVDGRIISSQVGLVKPDREIYELLLERYGLVAAETVFFDDLKVNCEAAEGLGIRAIRFINASDARARLRELEA